MASIPNVTCGYSASKSGLRRVKYWSRSTPVRVCTRSVMGAFAVGLALVVA
jgi:hypothetical protein